MVDDRLCEELAVETIDRYEQKIIKTISSFDLIDDIKPKETTGPVEKEYQDNGYDYKQFITELIENRKDNLMQQAMDRGIKLEHLQTYQETETFIDFDIENLITRMINLGIVSKENGYHDIKQIKHPDGIHAVKKRRTEAELD